MLRGLIDRLLLVAAVIAGGLVPGFIAQYRQRLGGRLEQAELDLAPWQKLADQFHHGDLAQLIQHNLASADATFQAEGHVIQQLVASVHALQAQVAALHTNLFGQAAYLIVHADPGLLRGTWRDFLPTFALSGEGLLFAALFALALWLLFQGLWAAAAALAAGRSRVRYAKAR
jgi:hypothetical protein